MQREGRFAPEFVCVTACLLSTGWARTETSNWTASLSWKTTAPSPTRTVLILLVKHLLSILSSSLCGLMYNSTHVHSVVSFPGSHTPSLQTKLRGFLERVPRNTVLYSWDKHGKSMWYQLDCTFGVHAVTCFSTDTVVHMLLFLQRARYQVRQGFLTCPETFLKHAWNGL